MTEGTRYDTGTESAKDVAKEEAEHLKEDAKSEAGRVTDEVKRQGRELIGETQDRIKEEADRQAGRTASGLKSMSSELRSMANNSEEPQSEVATWVRRGAEKIDSFADRLDRDGAEGVVRDLGNFARRNPTTFLVSTFGAGLLAGRLMKNMDRGQMTEGRERSPFAGETGTPAYERQSGREIPPAAGSTAPAAGSTAGTWEPRP